MSAARCASPLSWAPRAAAALLITLAWLATVGAAQSEPTFPVLTSRITDQAGLLSADDYTAIQAELAALEQKSTDQVAVVTLKSLDGYPIEDYGYQLGRKWGIGQKDKNNGILLIVAPNERKVRIEVGRGLEPVMTDAMSSLIIQNAILPEFRRGNFSAGVRAGVRDIKDVLLGDAEEVKERARQTRGDALDFWSIVLIVFWLCVVLFVLYAVVQSINSAPQAVGGRRRRSGADTVPGSSGGWGGGWSGGDSGGGGGWSGGGGDFGGGGSSGSW
jgi:uncharacterized protein